MKSQFEEYLRTIKIPDAIRGRIESLFPYVQLLCPYEIKALFVNDYVQEDGTHEYERVLFFSSDFVCEAKNFLIDYDIDVTPLKDELYYIAIKTQNYDLQKATEKSRLNVEAYSAGGPVNLRFTLKASKENCDYAVRIIREILQPNLRQSTASK